MKITFYQFGRLDSVTVEWPAVPQLGHLVDISVSENGDQRFHGLIVEVRWHFDTETFPARHDRMRPPHVRVMVK